MITAYKLYNEIEEVTMAVYELMQKLKEFEKFLCVDLERHIALRNGRCPFHLSRATQLLQRALDAVQTLEVVSQKSPGPWPDRDWDHLTAEIQTSLTEYGFCTTMDAIYDIDEATQKLDSLCLKLDKVEKTLKMDDTDVSVSLVELHSAEADHNGIQQSMTPANIGKLKVKFDKAKQRILLLENNLCGSNIKADSNLFMQYLAGQHLLRQDFVGRLFHTDSTSTITHHMIHPGTRGWLMERFGRWLNNHSKRLLILAGKHGSGKTALASAVCKLYNQHLVGCHFFDSSQGAHSWNNRLNGLIQNLAHNLCQTLPEYLNYLDDNVSSVNFNSLLSKGWRENYKLLLKEPLQSLFGAGDAKTKDYRHCIVVDALDECSELDWSDLRTFIHTFMKDMSNSFCVFVTVRNKHSSSIIPELSPDDEEMSECIRLEDRVWINRHIKDIEVYLSTSLGAILSGEDERELPKHAQADVKTLQNTIDELLKCSSGRFDYAIDLMESFAREMSASGQFLSSIKKAMQPVRSQRGNEFEQKMGDFASPYRAYRDKEGRSGTNSFSQKFHSSYHQHMN